MIPGSASCYPNSSQGLSMYEDNIVSSNPLVAGSGPETHSGSLLYNLSILKDKVHQVQSLVSILISPDHQTENPESTSLAISSMGSLVQEIIVTASSMIFICQQISLGTTSSAAGNNSNIDHHQLHQQHVGVPENNGISQQQLQQQQQQNFDNCLGNSILQERGQGFFPSSETIACWYGNNNNDDSANSRALQVSNNGDKVESRKELPLRSEITEGSQGVSVSVSPNNYDIIELDAADLLAKYTHYCQICGKGFKRDANLRMHMRAHGDEYKTTAALTNPMKNHHDGSSEGMGPNCSTKLPKKYSCPQEGCRWNKKHAKFQPLKSMICVKNHYKRSHCPKMYVCKRCNRKQFSVLSDLRTHEKHCGDLKWQCSCGTTFSRKDKLMGHVALFVGHSPVITSLTKPAKLEPQATTIQQDDRV